MESILTAEKVEFGYSDDKRILSNFNFQISKGGMTGLIGPNGAGKSTALKILSGYITPSSGRVSLNGKNITEISDKKRAKKIAVVAQNIFGGSTPETQSNDTGDILAQLSNLVSKILKVKSS